jgi:hypothetical protein
MEKQKRCLKMKYLAVSCLILIGLIELVSFISASTPGNINSCQVLNVSGVYNLTSNLQGSQVNSTGCFNITVSNVTLDCGGYFIRNTTLDVLGIYAGENLINITIKNCNVTMSSSGTGISFSNINNSFIINNTANSNSNGISLYSSSNNTLTGNTINQNTGGNGVYISGLNNILLNNTANSNQNGIYLDSNSNNNQIINNTANSNQNGIYLTSSSNNTIANNTANSNQYGIYLISISKNNNLTNNNIWNCTSSNGCFYFSSSSNNFITSGVINLSSANLVYLTINSRNNIFKDLVLLGATKNDTYLTSTSTNNTFINVSYNSSKEYVNTGSQLIRKWYYRAYVNDTTGLGVSNANVTAYNVSGAAQFTGLYTNSSGWTNVTTITDYMNNGTSRYYYSNYTINATGSSYLTNSHTYNASLENNLNDLFTLDIIRPVVSINYPISGATYGNIVNAINYTVNNASSCWYSNSSGVWNSSIQNAGTNFTSVITKEGSNTITLYCNDSSNIIGLSSIAFYQDYTNPNATLLTPLNNSYNKTDQNFTANLTDSLGLSNATLHIFNSANSEINTVTFTTISGSLQSVVGTVVSLTDGAYKWFYDVFDLGGNKFITQNNTFIKAGLNIASTVSVSDQGSLLSNMTLESDYSHLALINDSKGLIFYMPFDIVDGTSNVSDYSANNYDGVLTGTSYSLNCIYGGCRSFSGSTDKIAIGSDFINNQTITICAWINPLGFGGDNQGRIIDNGNTIFFINNSGELIFSSDGATNSNSALNSISLSSWQYACVTRNATGSSNFYINGLSNGALNQGSGVPSAGTTNVTIGNNAAGTNAFNGLIDDVMIFNTLLNSSQISAIYNNQSQRFASPGTQTFRQFNISAETSVINISLDGYSRAPGTNISLRLGQWDSSLGYNNSDLGGNNNLVAYYHFDEALWNGTTGEVKDAVGLYNGTGKGGINTTTTDGYFYRGGSFNGSNYISVPSNNALSLNTTNFTVSFWVKYTGLSYAYLIDKAAGGGGKGWGFVTSSGRIIFEINPYGGSRLQTASTNSYNDNNWHSVIGIANRTGNMSLYIDGNQVNTRDINSSSSFGLQINNPLTISNNAGFDSDFFNGSIDEIMIFNRSLTSDEVKELYVKGRALWNNYTSYQNLSEYNSVIPSSLNIFNITTSTTNILPDFKLLSDSYNFYTPNLKATFEAGPTSILTYPLTNASIAAPWLVNFQCNATGNYPLKNITLYIWNSTGSLITTNSTNITGTLNSTSFTYNFSYNDSYKWNCLIYDTIPASAWSSSNRTLNILTPRVTINTPKNITYYNNQISFYIDTNFNANCKYNLNNGTNITLVSIDEYSLDKKEFYAINSSIAYGNYTISAYCNDSLGNNFQSNSTNFSIVSGGQTEVNYFNISVNSTLHNRYGLSYPVTYEFNIPASSSNLVVYKRYYNNWMLLDERTANDFFNGEEKVRFNYTANKAYISVAFNDTPDSIYIRIQNQSGSSIGNYSNISNYYDNRKAVVTSTGDDWVGNELPNNAFKTACDTMASKHLWFTAGIITMSANITDYNLPPNWTDIQNKVSQGYIEPASHSRTHQYPPYANYSSEIEGSKQDILNNLTLPAFNRKGSIQYLYAWFDPQGQSDNSSITQVGLSYYLIDRGTVANNNFTSWNSTYGLYRVGNSVRMGSDGSVFLSDLNSAFDSVYNNRGIYHLFMHPGIVDFSQSSYADQHLDYIKERKDVWYVASGHLYEYHFVPDQNIISVSQVGLNITEEIIADEHGTINPNVTQERNITINATVTGVTIGAGNVWVKIWQGVIGSPGVIWQGFLNFISGNLWSRTIQTNTTYPTGLVNFTLYANDSQGNEINVSSNFTILPLYVNVTQCRALDQANTIYTLQNNITSNGTCFNITANSVTFNFNNYSITGNGTGYGVYLNNNTNANVSLGNILGYLYNTYLYLTNAGNNYISANANNYNTTLEGTGNTTLSVAMSNNLSSGNYYVRYDGISCSANPNCTVNSNSNGVVNVSLRLD